MVKISYAIEVELFGSNVHTHHFFNIVYYAVCLILIFRMLLLLFETYSLQSILWMVLIFAFIPLHSEVVASLKNRDVLLSFIFSMITLIYFLKWIKEKVWWYWIVIAASFLLALASKFDALPLIAVIPIIYIQKSGVKQRDKEWLKRVAIHIFLILLVLALMYIGLKKGQKLLLDPTSKQRIFNYFENPLYFDKSFIHKIFTMFNSLGFYLLMLFFPLKMSCYYGYNVIPVDGVFNLYGIIGIISFIWMVYLFFKRFSKSDILWYGIMFFGIHISMFLNFVKPAPGIVADRFTFTPSIGWAMIISYIIENLYQKYIEKKSNVNIAQFHWWNSGQMKLYIGIYFLLFSFLIWYRNYEWRYKLYLYEADANKYTESVKLHILYGSQIVIEYLQNSGKLPPQEMHKYLGIAFEEFQKGIKLDSTCGSCYNNAAFLYMNWKKDYAASIPYLLKSYKLDSTRKEMLNNVAISYLKTGRNKDTVELFARRAIKADKDKSYEIPYDVLKEFYKKERQYIKGIQFFQEELKTRPYSAFIHFSLAELYLLNGDTMNAMQTYQKLLDINPNYPDVVRHLSELKEKYKGR